MLILCYIENAGVFKAFQIFGTYHSAKKYIYTVDYVYLPAGLAIVFRVLTIIKIQGFSEYLSGTTCCG